MKATETPYPPTPELDKMKAVQSKSQAIGEFLDLFCGERGLALCTFRKAGDNGEPYYVWKDGVSICKRNRKPVAGQSPKVTDVMNGDADRNPEYEEWPDQYLPVNKSIEKLLAEYFEIDLNKVEAERSAILEHIRGED